MSCDCNNDTHPISNAAPFNELAIVSLITAIVFWPVGLATGLVARREIRRHAERGNALALAGILISAVMGAIWSLVLVLALCVSSGPGFGGGRSCGVGPVRVFGGAMSCEFTVRPASGYTNPTNPVISPAPSRPSYINPGGPMIPVTTTTTVRSFPPSTTPSPLYNGTTVTPSS